ncbi:hypothetical protein CR152_27720 [Massilia violaceinigra]|uniref:DUF551 domain-containing protein n=1 Tax=Massilia violaceinigra TaxID=2045208 RepID=A0A2D2DSC3_9BURK|nr:DUF551 domain-containing protein [Massilia violaceinigra]ATQ77867.1 hypothetical protein CR152_27720 [Massilia violaceinigra]
MMNEQKLPSAPTDVSKRLRAMAASAFTEPYREIDKLMNQAADEIERYYGGMLAWKKSAEAMGADGRVRELECVIADLKRECQEMRATPSGWVSVLERRPEVGQQVIVFLSNRRFGDEIMFDTWDEQRECPVDFSTISVPVGEGWNEHDFEEISHWMPLPPAPGAAPAQPVGLSEQEVEKLQANLAWHKAALTATNGKLAAVWEGIREVVQEYAGKPCEGEPFDRLDELLKSMQPSVGLSEQDSIDTPEFQRLAHDYRRHQTNADYLALVAYIDAAKLGKQNKFDARHELIEACRKEFIEHARAFGEKAFADYFERWIPAYKIDAAIIAATAAP